MSGIHVAIIVISVLCDMFWISRFVTKAASGKVTGIDVLWLSLNICITIGVVIP